MSRLRAERHEERDADVVSLSLIMLCLFISAVVVFLIVAGLQRRFQFLEAAKIAGPAVFPLAGEQEFAAPELEVSPGVELGRLRAAEESDLNSYGWIDRNADVVHIPIERAMRLLLVRGLPEVGAGETPLGLMQARPSETATPLRLQPSPE